MNFGEEIEKHRIPIKNRPDIFGRQLIVDEDDNIVAEEENLLSNATDISRSAARRSILRRPMADGGF